MSEVRDDPLFKCPKCGVTCNDLSELEGHLKTHMTIRQNVSYKGSLYKCDQCHKAYVLKSSLTRHRKKHILDSLSSGENCENYPADMSDQELEGQDHTQQKSTVTGLLRETSKLSPLSVINGSVMAYQQHRDKVFVKNLARPMVSLLKPMMDPVDQHSSLRSSYISGKDVKMNDSQLSVRDDSITSDDQCLDLSMKSCATDHNASVVSDHDLSISLNGSHLDFRSQPLQVDFDSYDTALDLSMKTALSMEESVGDSLSVKTKSEGSNQDDKGEFQKSSYLDQSCDQPVDFSIKELSNTPSASPKVTNSLLSQYSDTNRESILMKYNETVKDHNVNSAFKCKKCPLTFTDRYNLLQHSKTHRTEQSHSEDAQFKCMFCGLKYADQTTFNRHIRSHYKSHTFYCQYCCKMFTNQETFKLHLTSHEDRSSSLFNLYSCNACTLTFQDKNEQVKHLKLHRAGEKPFMCGECNKGFPVKSYLDSHMRVHVGDKPFKCPECGRGFSHSFNLTKHLRTHTGERPYRCDLCQQTFGQKNSLNRHMMVHAEHKAKIRHCHTCQINFQTEEDFLQHLRTVHDMNINDSFQNFKGKSSLRDFSDTDLEHDLSCDSVTDQNEHTPIHNVECEERSLSPSVQCESPSVDFPMEEKNLTVINQFSADEENKRLRSTTPSMDPCMDESRRQKSQHLTENQNSDDEAHKNTVTNDFEGYIKQGQGHMMTAGYPTMQLTPYGFHHPALNFMPPQVLSYMQMQHFLANKKSISALDDEVKVSPSLETSVVEGPSEEVSAMDGSSIEEEIDVVGNSSVENFPFPVTKEDIASPPSVNVERNKTEEVEVMSNEKSVLMDSDLTISQQQVSSTLDVSEVKSPRAVEESVTSTSSDVEIKKLLEEVNVPIKGNETDGYQCPECGKMFKKKNYVKSHLRTHSSVKPYVCSLCKKGFSHSFNLTKHYRSHTGEKPYSCSVCSRQFSHVNSLNRHLLLHTSDEELSKTSRINAAFENNDMNVHAASLGRVGGPSDVSYEETASEADDSFNMKAREENLVQSHVNILKDKHNEHYSFNVKAHEEIHAQNHVNVLNDIQNEHYSFNMKAHEEIHAQNHVNVLMDKQNEQSLIEKVGQGHKDISSDKDDKAELSSTTTLPDDLRSVSQKAVKGQYKCAKCHLECSSYKALQAHFKVHAYGKRRHSCDICNKEFNCFASLLQHKKDHDSDHIDSFTCDLCDQSFDNRNFYQKHVLDHSIVNN